MKYAHFIEMRVFCKEEDNQEIIEKKIHELFPFDFEKEKLIIKSKKCEGFEDKIIKILTVSIKKEKHTKLFLKNLIDKISDEQKKLLEKQLESRLDETLHFYIRLDKEKLLNNEYWITDYGNCFHITISIAAYPHKRETAVAMVKNILGL